MARKKARGNGEGTVFQRPNGLWCAQVTVGRDETGKLKRRTIYGKTRREVVEKLNKLFADAQNGLPLDVGKQTTEEFLLSWLNTIASSIRPTTLENYQRIVKNHLVPEIGKIKLAKLSPQHLAVLYRKKQEEGHQRTASLCHAVLHKALGQATKWGLVPRNVADLVDRPRVQRKEMKTLTAEQVARLLEAAQGERLGALYVLAVTTGLREGELLGLKWQDIDFDAGTLQVRRQLQWVNGGPQFSEPKSAKSRRVVALPETALVALKKHRVAQAQERLRMGEAWQDNDLVFATEIGTPIHKANFISREFHPFLEKAGLPHIRFHDLRHTAATLLLEQGVHPKVVQEQLGHSQISLTLDTYSHVVPTMLKDAASKMDELLRKTK